MSEATQDALEEAWDQLDPLLRRAALMVGLQARREMADHRPTPRMIMAGARRHGVARRELAGVFGYITYQLDGRSVWIDVLKPQGLCDVPDHAAADCEGLAFHQRFLKSIAQNPRKGGTQR